MNAAAPQFRLQLGLEDIPSGLTSGVVAIGNFDGVHLGHKAVLADARAEAKNGQPVVALTFEPHPRSFFRPDQPIPRLSPAPEKRLLLSRQSLDGMVELSFDAALAGLTAEEFVADILAGALRAQTVVVGWDFHFGKGRGGTPSFLAESGPRHGFAVKVILPFGGASPVSSSAIRARLTTGDIEAANDLLGHRWFVLGEVVGGDRRGRELGYPTANLVLPPETPLAEGIYAVRIAVDGQIHDGVAGFGRRPQFHQDAPPLLEPHLFDFAGDLYGKTIGVEFLARLRGEQKFDGVDALIAQMDRDSAQARKILTAPGRSGVTSVFD